MWISNNKIIAISKNKLQIYRFLNKNVDIRLGEEFKTIFETLNTPNEDKISTKKLYEVSNEYRNKIKVYNGDIADLSEAYQLNEIELIWNLIENIYLNKSEFIIVSLVQWISWHFVSPFEEFTKLISQDFSLTNKSLWKNINILTVMGQIDIIYNYLANQLEFIENDIGKKFLNILQQCPIMKVIDANNVDSSNLVLKHSEWSFEAQKLLNLLEGLNNKDDLIICIIKMLKIITFSNNLPDVSGDVESLPWYALFIAKLFYQRPTITNSASDLGLAVDEFVDQVVDSSQFKELDTIILKIFKQDVFGFITDICSYFDSWWFAVHIIDLISKVMDITLPSQLRCDIREFIILNWVSTISDNPKFYHLLPTYLSTCPIYGKFHLEIYLSKISIQIDIEADTEKYFQLFTDIGSANNAFALARRVALHYRKTNEYEKALSWCLKSSDYKLADLIAIDIMASSSEMLRNPYIKLIESLRKGLWKTSTLAYLTKFADLVTNYRTQNFGLIEMDLINMLNTPLPHPKLIHILLKFIDEYLTASALKDTLTIYEIMRWVIDNNISEISATTFNNASIQSQVCQRLSLNLASSLVAERGEKNILSYI